MAGDLEKTEDPITSASLIFERENHPEKYEVLEILADLYQAKARQAFREGKDAEVKRLSYKASHYLQEALRGVQIYFSKDSVHTLRIQTKIKEATPVF